MQAYSPECLLHIRSMNTAMLVQLLARHLLRCAWHFSDDGNARALQPSCKHIGRFKCRLHIPIMSASLMQSVTLQNPLVQPARRLSSRPSVPGGIFASNRVAVGTRGWGSCPLPAPTLPARCLLLCVSGKLDLTPGVCSCPLLWWIEEALLFETGGGGGTPCSTGRDLPGTECGSQNFAPIETAALQESLAQITLRFFFDLPPTCSMHTPQATAFCGQPDREQFPMVPCLTQSLRT